MEQKDKKFEEQDHPLKTTDHAFVQVGKNGEPVIPEQGQTKDQQPKDNDRVTTIDHR